MFNIDHLTRPLPFKARRYSSYDRTGANGDVISIAPHSTGIVFDTDGSY